MKKSEKNSSTGRTIYTRSLGSSALVSIEHQNHGLRRPNRGTPPKNPITPATTTTRKSERLASSPSSVAIKSGRMEKKNSPSPLRSSGKGKNIALQSSKGSDDSNRKTDTSSDIEQRKDKKENTVQEWTDKIKKREPKMSARTYRALFRAKLKNAEELVDTSSNDDELVVVGCSRRIPASNDDAHESNTECPPSANSELERLPGGETSLEKGTVVPSTSDRDTENMVPDAIPMDETGNDTVIGSPFENTETQKRLVSKTSLETDIELPLKRERDTAEIVLDACAIVANGDDRNLSADGVLLSPPGCKNDNQRGTCSTCVKRQKVNGDSQYLSICSCTAQPVKESDHMAKDIRESGVATRRDNEENMQMQHDNSLHLSIYPEYWVPVQLSNVQLEQYCRTLFSKSLSLPSMSKYSLGALEETLSSIRKTCDHPYVMDASYKQVLTKNLQLHEILGVEVKASGKLHLLDAMLTQIQKNGLKAVVFYQATQSLEGLMLSNILEDFVSQRFGQKSYEHGICTAKKHAINTFNKEKECFILLLETRACSQSIKLLRAEVFIIFRSSLNPSCDVKHLQKIKIESYSERTKIFRLYSVYTVEEKALIMARQKKWQNRRGDQFLEDLNRSLLHALLMWGATFLFDKLDRFHVTATPDSGLSLEQCIMDNVSQEFSSILSSKGGEAKEGKLCLILEAGSTLFGEKHIKLSDEDSPNMFWTKLVKGRNPTWKYTSETPQRNRKRVQYFEGSEKSPKIGDGGNTKKRKKASDYVTDLPLSDPLVTAPPVDNVEEQASGRDNIGALESPKVKALPSLSKSTSVTSGTSLDCYSMGGHIFGIPEDMLTGHDWRQIPRDSQRRLHAVLKSEMAKLGNVLQLSEDWTRMVEKFLEYVIENHRICEEPASIWQAFLMALSWIAALLVKQKINRKESLARAKSELAFDCSRQEVDYIYSILYCMKSRIQGLQLDCLGTSSQQATVGQEKNSMKSMHRLEGVECITEKRGSRYSTTTKDIEKTISDIKRKCKKRVKILVQKHEEEKLEVIGKYADKKQELESTKRVEEAVIRIACSGTSSQSLVDDLKRLNHDSDRRFKEIASEEDKCLKSLEQMLEAQKKKLAEDEACWISRIENWAQAVLKNCAPIKSGNNKHFSGICLSNTSENAPDVPNGEATYADTNCMVSKENQVSEALNTLGTVPGVSTRQVHELVGPRNDKAMDVSTLVSEQPTEGVPIKSQSNEHASITVPENLVAAGCHEKFTVLNVHLSEDQNCGKSTSATPDEDVSSRVPEMSQSISNLVRSASPEFALNGDEALVTIKDNRTSHVSSDANNILDQHNEDTCSLEREKPDELVLLMPHPESVVATRGSAGTDKDDQDICPMPSSLAGKQPDFAANIRGQNIEAAIEPASTGSEIVETADIAGSGIVETTDCAASNEDDLVTGPLPLSPAGNKPVPEANIESQNISTRTSAEPHVAGPDAVESGDNEASDPETMVAQDACSLPYASVGTQSDLGTIIEGQNMTAMAQLPTGGSDAVEAGGSPVSDQETMIAQDACSLPTALVGTQSDLGANVEGQNMTTVAQLPTDRLDAVEAGGSHVSDQDTQDASPLPLSLPENHLDSVVNVEGLNNTTVAEPHTTGSDVCEMETAEPGLQVERPTFANIVHEAGVEPSAGVTAPVPSLLNNGTEQSAVQPVPQIPFPAFNDPHQHELEKLRRESENSVKIFEEKKSILKAELERRMAEVQAEFRRKFNEVEAEHKTRTTEIETSKNFIIMNKLLANAFLSKCTEKKAAPRGRTQQLVQRATQVSALRNSSPPASASRLEAPTFAAPLQPQAPLFHSSGSRPSGLPLNTGVYPMPQPRQPLISNVSPTPSASPATNPVVNARQRAPAPHLNSYRPSSSPPIATATQTSSRPPHQALTTAQQQQVQQPQQNLSSGLQGNNGVVCLSDDE